MIGYLRGIARTERILDVNGVGYMVACPTPLIVGDETELHVHTTVREDAINLYGFLTTVDKAIFEALIKVNGVGPSVGLALLANLGASTVTAAIQRKDIKTLSSVRGVGAKLAEKIVTLCNLPAGVGDSTQLQEIVNVLLELGFERKVAAVAANTAIDELGAGATETAIITLAISYVTKSGT